MMRNIAIVGQGSKVYRTWGLNQIDLIPPNIYSFILFKNSLSFFLKRSSYLYTFMTSFPFRKNNYRFYKKKKFNVKYVLCCSKLISLLISNKFQKHFLC